MTEKQAIHKLASYCSKSERCEYDIRKKLLAWEIDANSIQGIINYLKRENFLDESRYCRSYISDKLRFNKWGRTKIIYELKKKQIPVTVIDKAFTNFAGNEFEEPLLRILDAKSKTVNAGDSYEKRQKLFRYAVGRGYEPALVNSCLNKIMQESGTHELDL